MCIVGAEGCGGEVEGGVSFSYPCCDLMARVFVLCVSELLDSGGGGSKACVLQCPSKCEARREFDSQLSVGCVVVCEADSSRAEVAS